LQSPEQRDPPTPSTESNLSFEHLFVHQSAVSSILSGYRAYSLLNIDFEKWPQLQ